MVAVFTKELLSWYLITLKLKEIVDAGIRRSGDFFGDQQPSNDLQIDINGDSRDPKEGPRSPESEWMITIRQKLELAREDDVGSTCRKLCIYEVPQYLRENDDKSYTPSIVSLGPYHRGQIRLLPMDRHKWRAFDQILKRTNHDAKLYIDSIKELEETARGFYEGHITLNSNEFVEMMVLDGCFILELFRGADKGFAQLGYPWYDPVFAMRGTMHSIQLDMIMLENQIPMFILDRLLGLQLSQPEHNSWMVTKLALKFFDPLMLTEVTEAPDKMESSPRFKALLDHTYLHCLHVFRQSLLHSEPPIRPIQQFNQWFAYKRRTQLIHCVTELKEAGIKFKKQKTNLFWDIKFENGILKIPQLLIDDGTKSLFLNLIAFEQSYLDCGNKITAYVMFMDNLINLPEDVAYLRHRGIFKHSLGSDSEVADLFNRLCQEVAFDKKTSYLSKVSGEVNSFNNKPWNKWRASLMHAYFRNPWAIISLIAAVILLILTFTQTFYGVYGYYRLR